MEFECPVCHERYNAAARTPMVLTCGHTLCERCVKILANKTCPVCRQPFSRFSKNYTVAGIIERPRKQLHDYRALFKICIVGESGVGKTTILNGFESGRFEEKTQTTIGLGFHYVTEERDGKAYKFEMWDTGGQEKFRALTRSYYKGSDLVIITYSLSDRRSFVEAENHWLNQVKEVAPEAKILLLGNKLDQGAAVTIDEIGDLCKQTGCLEARVSCRTAQNIRQTWRIISDTLINSYVDRSTPSTVSLQSGSESRQSSGCICSR